TSGTRAPRVASVQILAIIIGYPTIQHDVGSKVAGTGAAADIDDRCHGVCGLRLHISRPRVKPGGISAGANMTIKSLKFDCRTDALAISFDVRAGEAPEVIGFRGRGV